MAAATGLPLSERIAETLYADAMLLAEETHAYFAGAGRTDRAALVPKARVQFAQEAVKATIRLMQILTWLAARHTAESQLGESTPSESDVLGIMPTAARQLIMTGIDLHGRAGRLAAGVEAPIAAASPARALFQRRERTF
ncbi:DUF1465 family protein [Sphingomonas crusticola]|uniref:DUF1465 family protein n=1 Tax=Sphingomonas crusticola TaxID=1697973 RepID=UPI000E289653|nr:DUF1465 family protein [Sphingomonas crusticola]